MAWLLWYGLGVGAGACGYSIILPLVGPGRLGPWRACCWGSGLICAPVSSSGQGTFSVLVGSRSHGLRDGGWGVGGGQLPVGRGRSTQPSVLYVLRVALMLRWVKHFCPGWGLGRWPLNGGGHREGRALAGRWCAAGTQASVSICFSVACPRKACELPTAGPVGFLCGVTKGLSQFSPLVCPGGWVSGVSSLFTFYVSVSITNYSPPQKIYI